MTSNNKIETTKLFVQGLIQGVGFRPFIYRIADKHNLSGNVCNQNNGVVIHVQGKGNQIEKFINSIKHDCPVAARVDSIEVETIQEEKYKVFEIINSKKVDDTITRVSPDIAVCEDCLNDLKNQSHRIAYPFTNCTNCGPRYSIIENIPYDREFTSMKYFEMCPVCRQEYNTISNRRFHAQPVACNSCGPCYTLHTKNGVIESIDEILEKLSLIIRSGGTVALKGLGGYHLACDAFNSGAIEKLRKIKNRDGKPFALMFSSIDSAKLYAEINKQEELALSSWQRPIILVKSKHQFDKGIAGSLNTLGVFLPYLPFHYQLFEVLKTNALVMTSCNISDCPIISEDEKALEVFRESVDAVLTHNREIVNKLDDSVAHKIGNKIQIIRRSRGYAPEPIQLNETTEGILAVGAELSNAFAIGKDKQAILSQHIGDLKNLETMEFFEQTLQTLKLLFQFSPSHVVCDMHPEYLSTKFAENTGLPLIKTQHHHAHIAACMAEYEIDEPVIGLAFDGTGFGTDGKIWGSEIMVADLSGFERKHHFEYVPIPGGDRVSKEPWRSALSYLYLAYDGKIPQNLSFLEGIDSKQLELVKLAIKNKINSPESSSAGRLFDAVSAMLSICRHATYHAEAPILLEHQIEDNISDYYPLDLQKEISWQNVIKMIVNDLNNRVSTQKISAKFHNTFIQISFEAIKKIHAETGINKVVLAGGSFQNKYISENLLDLLHKSGLTTYIPAKIPVNDGAIALGQLAIAAKTLALCV